MTPSDIAVNYVPVTIANGETESSIAELGIGEYLVGIRHPAITTSTEFNFEVGIKDDDLVDMSDGSGSAYAVTIPATPSYFPVLPGDFAGIKCIKVKVADAQIGDKVIYLATRSY